MNLSSRWHIFSKTNKNNVEIKVEEEEETNQEQSQSQSQSQLQSQNNDEVVFSVNECDKTESESSGMVKTIFESNCNNNNNNNDSNSHYKGFHTELMPTMPVLFIEEFFPPLFYSRLNKRSVRVTDWRAYIYYDSSRGVYVLNGTRRRSDERGVVIERRFPDICMRFKSKSSLAFYLRKSTCSWKHKLNVTMYSMYRGVIHLTTCGAMPTFYSIHNCRNKFRTELFGYDDCRVSLIDFESYLKMLKDGADNGFLFRPTSMSML